MEELLKSNYVTEITDGIEKMFENIPDKRKKLEYSQWKNDINKLIKRVNQLSKIKMYQEQ